jgi:acyl carrier protein
MLPRYVKVLDALPLTVSGKVNKKALPTPDATWRLGTLSSADSAHKEPRTAIELFVWRAWSSVLEIVDFGIDEEFADLGGHSILALALVDHVQEQCGCDLDIAALLKCATVEAFADALQSMGYRPT